MRLYIIDVFRFFAALSVVFYHYTARTDGAGIPELQPFTQFGYLGVPLFFMISGFVISASAENRSPRAFLVSRAARLYPSYWVGIVLTVSVVWLLGDIKPSGLQTLTNMTMLNDYLGIKNLDGVYWTLQVELKFYACIFILLSLKLFSKHQLWLSAWLACTLAYSITNQPFFMPWLINPNYSAFFISGIACYLIYRDGLTKYAASALSIACLLCLYHANRQAHEFMPNATRSDLHVVTLFILLFHGLFLLVSLRKLSLKPRLIYIYLGGITYPLYLIHNRAGKTLIASLSTEWNRNLAIVTTLFIALAISFVIFKFIEPAIAKVVNSILKKMLHMPAATSKKEQ